jgi:tRNA(fMet)-specific endonuclease VapC
MTVLGFDDAAAAAAADIRQVLEARGTPIGMADYMIAGICRARSGVLMTRNRSHFERIPGLRLSLFRDE